MTRLAAALLLLATAPALADVPVAGYRDNTEHEAACRQLAQSEWVTCKPIGTTARGHQVLALTVSSGHAWHRPAALVVGSVDGRSLVGSRLALRMVSELVERLDKGDPALERLLSEVTLHVIPRPSPDAADRLFEAPYGGGEGNFRPADDDRDGRSDEDPPADLNGDGWITQMRVLDQAGEWIPHPDDPRVMIKADPAKGEVGRYRLLAEDNADDDGDGRFAEDGVGGTVFDRNFTFKYPYFKPGAGPHQVSEPETRAVADFAFDHPNIFLVFSFSPQANLLHTWKSGGKGKGVTSTVAEPDAAAMRWFGERYRKRFDTKPSPDAGAWEGSFAAWAYFHYGRWSLSSPGWWPAAEKKKGNTKAEKPEAEESEPEESTEGSDADSSEEAPPVSEPSDKPRKKKPSGDKRGKTLRQQLAWLDTRGVEAFVPWTRWEGEPIEGIDGPIEIGGLKPFVATHPPVDELDLVAAAHLDYLCEILAGRPKLIFDQRTDTVVGGVTTTKLRVVNTGVLPTAAATGKHSGLLPRHEVALELPPGAVLLAGPLRQPLPVMQSGEKRELTWLWRDGTGPAKLRAGAAYQRDAEGRLPLIDPQSAEKTR